jgi:hypothetical protein
MRRTLVSAAVLSAVLWCGGKAGAEPPVHDSIVTKNNTAVITPLPDCPAPNTVAVVLEYSEQTHFIGTATTFHFTNTQTGTLTALSASGEVVATGHFTATFNDQGPGFPKESSTGVIHATIHRTDGVNAIVHILNHFTVTPAGDVTSEFSLVNCN